MGLRVARGARTKATNKLARAEKQLAELYTQYANPLRQTLGFAETDNISSLFAGEATHDIKPILGNQIETAVSQINTANTTIENLKDAGNPETETPLKLQETVIPFRPAGREENPAPQRRKTGFLKTAAISIALLFGTANNIEQGNTNRGILSELFAARAEEPEVKATPSSPQPHL